MPRELVKNPVDETIVAPIRKKAIWVLRELIAAKIQTHLTEDQVQEALAFHILGDFSLQRVLTGPLDSDAWRIWRFAPAGSQILLKEGFERLEVRDATWLQRLAHGLPVEPRKDNEWEEGPRVSKRYWYSPRPLEVTNGHREYGSLPELQREVEIAGLDTPNNIGLFIPAPLKSVVFESR